MSAAHGQAIAGSITTGASPYAVAVNPVSNRVYVASGAGSVSVIGGATGTVLSTVTVGSTPYAVAVNPTTGNVYVANRGAGTVSVINGATNMVSATVTVGTQPSAIAVDGLTNKVYVANYGSTSVSVIDGASNTAKSVTVGSTPTAVAVNPVTDKVYVTNFGSNSVSVIDGTSGAVTATVAVGKAPWALAVNPITDQVYVADFSDNTVAVIDGSTDQAAMVTVGAAPYALAVNPVTNQIYVANRTGGTVSVLDGASRKVTATVTVGSAQAAVAVNSATSQVLVVNSTGNSVTVIAGGANTAKALAVGTSPVAVAVNPVTNLAYVTNKTTGTVSVINPAVNTLSTIVAGPSSPATAPTALVQNPVTGTIYVANKGAGTVSAIDGTTQALTTVTSAGKNYIGNAPWLAVVNPVTNMIYVGNEGAGAGIAVIDGRTNTVTTTVPAGTNPWGMALNPVTNMIYACNYGSGDMTVIDGATNTVAATVTVGTNPVAVAVDSLTDRIYVANSGSANVTVVDGTSNAVIGTIAVGASPWALAINQQTGTVYVANEAGKSVSVISEATETVTATVAVGTNPWALTLSPISNTVYVADYGSTGVSVIDGASNTVTATITVGSGAAALAINPITNQIYVANKTSATVSVIDGNSNTVTATLATGNKAAPASVVVDPVTNLVYVGNSGINTVTVIDPTGAKGQQVVPITISANGPAGDSLLVAAANTAQGTPYITENTAPVFTATVTPGYPTSSGYANDTTQMPRNPPVTALYYSIDEGLGTWSQASSSAGSSPATFSLPLAAQSVGMHTLYLYAAYGNEGVASSMSSGSGNSPELSGVSVLSYMVRPLDTKTTLRTDINPQDINLQVTLTASVTSASGTNAPTGMVSFYDAISGTPVLLGTDKLNVVGGSDIAELQTKFTSSGSHTLTAVYLGNSSFVGSTGSMSETVVAPLTTTQVVTSVTLSQNQTLPGFTPVVGSGGIGALTLSVAPALPAGLVFSSVTGAVSGTPLVASPSMSYTITVTDRNGATATGSFTLVVNQPGGSTAKITVAPSPADVTDQQSPTLAVTVSGSGITPTGVLTFSTGSAFEQHALIGGAASFAVPSAMLTTGSNTLTVYYSGDGTYAAGSGQATVTEYPVVLSVPSMAAIAHGASGTMTATVSAGSSYAGTLGLTCVLTGASPSAQVVPACSISPTAVTLAKDATGSVTLTVNANTPSLFTQVKQRITGGQVFACGSLLGALALFLVPGKRRRLPGLLMLFAMILGLTAMTGCGSGVYGQYLPATGAVTPGSYTFTVTGVDSKTPTITTNVVTFTVTIQ